MARTGLRERKKEQTRVDLIEAAVELFQEKGYEETTVEDIVERANYSRSTFFRYFGNKEDVLFGDLPERLKMMVESLQDAGVEGDPLKRAREAIIHGIMDFTGVAPELESACVALWFSEPVLYRRYTVMVLESEQILTDFFASSWGVDPEDDIECATLAAGIIGLARATIQLQLADRAAVRRSLNRGFDLLEQGAARTGPRLRRRATALRRADESD